MRANPATIRIEQRGRQAHFAPKTPQSEPVPVGFVGTSKESAQSIVQESCDFTIQLKEVHWRHDSVTFQEIHFHQNQKDGWDFHGSRFRSIL